MWRERPGGKASFQGCLGASLKPTHPGTAKAAACQRLLLYQDAEGLMNQDDSGKAQPVATMVYREIFIDRLSAADFLWQGKCGGEGSGVCREWKWHCPLCVWWTMAGHFNEIICLCVWNSTGVVLSQRL